MNSKSNDVSNFKNTDNVYKMQCFPLYSILLAIGKTDIDYFSLDVEGYEYKILNTIPWHKVNVKVCSFFLLLSNCFCSSVFSFSRNLCVILNGKC